MFDFKNSQFSKKEKKCFAKLGVYDLNTLLSFLEMTTDDFIRQDPHKVAKKIVKRVFKKKQSPTNIKSYLIQSRAVLIDDQDLPSRVARKTLLINVKLENTDSPILDLETAIVCAQLHSSKSIPQLLEAYDWLGKYPIYICKRDLYNYRQLVRYLKKNADFIYSF